MKKYITTITALLCGVMVFGQTEWLITGNTGLNEVNNFIGTTDDVALRFRTDNAFRMGLDGTTGFLGLNTTTPLMRFHVLNGGILSTGTTGTNPNIGAGTRLMWIPDQGAFRVGTVTGNQWDGANVGDELVG